MIVTDYQAHQIAARDSFYVFAAKAFQILEPGTNFELSWHLECIAEFLEAVYRGEIKRLIINMPPRTLKSFMVARAFPAWVMGKKPETKFIASSYGHEVAEQSSLACRRLMKDPWYLDTFKATRIGELDRNTHFETTMAGQYYAASALSPIVGLGADIILLDDLIKPMEAGSETVRTSVNENIRSTFFSRLNDKRTGAIILVMQRVHEEDPTGHLLKDGGWVHLKLPAETNEHIEIELNGKKWTMSPGDLLMPSRLSREILDQTRLDMSEYHYCTPAESPVLMADLSTKMVSEILPGDKVMGFTIGSIDKRKELTPALVQKVACRESPVVKITLDSGKVIRCTPDHRWYNGRSNHKEKYRKLYYPAKVGSRLSRICEPFLPKLETEADFRMAGWLSGFYDGDGSAVVQRGTKTCMVTFAQGTGRNISLCLKLEEALKYFGFDFIYDERVRSDNKSSNHLMRTYRLKGNAIENNRKLLHLIKVNKWRERINGGSFCSRFVKAEERVVSIEPDGVEPVYSLTTSTGNYVVWGLASSNCGQYLQEPVPAGGGEFREDMLQWYSPGSIKPREMNVVILVDPSGGVEINKKKKKHSDWTVMDVWGLAADNNYYLLDRIRDRLNPTERVDTLFLLHRKWNDLTGKPPKCGYERYGMMGDTHYIREKQRQDAYHFPLVELGGQMMKEERIRMLIPVMQNGRMYFPATLPYVDIEGRKFDLIKEMIDEMQAFPRAKWDDILDNMSRLFTPELYLQFPRKKSNMAQKAYRSAGYSREQSWEDM